MTSKYQGIAGKKFAFEHSPASATQKVEKQPGGPAKQVQPTTSSSDKNTKPDKLKQTKEEEGAKNVQASAPQATREWDGTCYRQKLGKHDESYGRPPPGSKTEVRGKKAGTLVTTEVAIVCQVIHDGGHKLEDGTYIAPFGFLFEIYTKISNKLVGMLLRARRQGLVEFEGEMLYQGRDDNVMIKLVKIPKILEKYVLECDGSIPDHMKMDI